MNTRNCFWRSAIMLALMFGLVSFRTRGQTAVEQGSLDRAQDYYKQLSKSLQFVSPDTVLNSSLDDVLQYLGYTGLHAVDLDRLDPAVLMDYDQLKSKVSDPVGFTKQFATKTDLPKGNIVVSRFFAPKITDDSHLPPNAYGWRKLVRLLPNQKRGTADAANKFVERALILYNYFQNDLSRSPFDPSNITVNIQVALVSTRDSIASKPPHTPIYWLDYAKPPGYKINFSLDATFDARDPILPVKPYFVPEACVACHGNRNKPLLNYLDTDHWIDRAESSDFSNFRSSNLPVLFDAGTRNEGAPEYKAAFDIVRSLNSEIYAQNNAIAPKAFQTAAAKNWMTLHSTNVTHVLPIARAIPTPPATQSWTKGNAVDEKILPLLNQYCFRCHGSIGFNVFDKGQVVKLEMAAKMKTRIQFDPIANPTMERRVGMPPDRELPAADKAALLEFFNNLVK